MNDILIDGSSSMSHQMMRNTKVGSSYEISTQFDGGKAQFGAMFDIRSLPNTVVLIDSMAFHTLKPLEECSVQVFTKTGSHEYFEETSSAWKRIISTTARCNGPLRKTTISFRGGNVLNLDDVRIGSSERRSFYIRVIETQIIYTVANQKNKVYVEDDHVQIFTGVAVGGYFKDYWAPRMLNVDTTYTIEKLLDDLRDDDFGPPADPDVCTHTLDAMTPDGVTKNFGLMFNVKSNSEEALTVFGLGFYVYLTSSIEYDIYILKGGFVHPSATTDKWVPVARGIKEDATKGSLIMISGTRFAPVKLNPGETYGFYITLHTENLLYHSTSATLGSTYLHNKDLTISVGSGVGSQPLNEFTELLDRRALHGEILYGKDIQCRPEIPVKYTFIVEYPKTWSSEYLHNEISINVKKVVNFLIGNDKQLKAFKDDFDLGLSWVFSRHDTNPSALCSATPQNLACDTIETEIALSYDGDLDEGQVTYNILQHASTVVTNLNNKGSLIVQYTGEASLDTSMVITLAGVPDKTMSNKEVGYFQGITKGFLKEKEEGTLEILSVEVRNQALKSRRHLAKNPLPPLHKTELYTRDTSESTSIDIQIKVTGKHRPPSPGLNFDELVPDTINADDGAKFKNELINAAKSEPGKDSGYFESVKQIYAKPVNVVPTKAPTLMYIPQDSQNPGLNGPISIAIIIGAALLTFGMVFGAFVLRKRQRDKDRFKKSIFDDDEDDPLFFDSFDNKKQKHHKDTKPNTTHIAPFDRGGKRSSKSIQSSAQSSNTEAITEDTREDMMYPGEYPYDPHAPYPSKQLSRLSPQSQSRPQLDFYANTRSNYGGLSEETNGPMVRRDRMPKHSSRIMGANDRQDHDYEDYNVHRGGSLSRDDAPFDYEERIRRKKEEIRPSFRREENGGSFNSREESMRSEGSHERRIRMKYGAADDERGNHQQPFSTSRQEDERGYRSGRSLERDDLERNHHSPSRERATQSRRNFERDSLERNHNSQVEDKDRQSRRNFERVQGEDTDHQSRRDFERASLEKNHNNQEDDKDHQSRRDFERASLERNHNSQEEEKHQGPQKGLDRHALERNNNNNREDEKGLEPIIDLDRDALERNQNKKGEERAWDNRKRGDAPKQPEVMALPAHLRFQRRPSEDGAGISIASASTSSTISTKFTKMNPA